MTDKINFATFEERASALIERLAVISELFDEADDLLMSLDFDNLDDDEQYDAWEIAHEITDTFGARMDDFSNGMWMPSTC